MALENLFYLLVVLLLGQGVLGAVLGVGLGLCLDLFVVSEGLTGVGDVAVGRVGENQMSASFVEETESLLYISYTTLGRGRRG